MNYRILVILIKVFAAIILIPILIQFINGLIQLDLNDPRDNKELNIVIFALITFGGIFLILHSIKPNKKEMVIDELDIHEKKSIRRKVFN